MFADIDPEKKRTCKMMIFKKGGKRLNVSDYIKEIV